VKQQYCSTGALKLKQTRNVSLDTEVIDAVDKQTEKGKFCLSKWVNNALKDELKDELKKK